MNQRRILHVDADAFFVQVARQSDPEGAGRARLLIVGGRPGSRGVVCSASYECREYGVRSAMPIARALRLCPQAMCVPVPRRACSTASRAIAQVLGEFTPVLQASSIDEWYLDLGGTEALYRGEPLAETARRIRDRVIEATGLTVSIGGGTTRLVAKLAVERAKPKPGTSATGVYVVAPGEEAAFVATLAVGDLPMVGPRFQQRLADRGLRRVADVQALSCETLQRMVGDRAGAWLYDRARGIDSSPVATRDDAKQMSREDTFDRDLHDEAEIARELLRLSVRVASDLRREERTARTITVKLRDADFTTRSARRTLEEPVRTDRVIYRVASDLLARLRRSRRVGVRLLGVALSHFDESVELTATQFDLFGAPSPTSDQPHDAPRDHALAAAVDRIRSRFGDAAIVPATLVAPEQSSVSARESDRAHDGDATHPRKRPPR
ncbi:MAG: DNA polymerase IV [Gemmatimonadaceae bacterium]|nr:DNA polymerase IV [Gemmatimonadaceae bacterium]